MGDDSSSSTSSSQQSGESSVNSEVEIYRNREYKEIVHTPENFFNLDFATFSQKLEIFLNAESRDRKKFIDLIKEHQLAVL